MALFNVELKLDLLMAQQLAPCCKAAFLMGISTYHDQNIWVRAPRRLRPSIVKTVKSVLPPGASVNRIKSILQIVNIDALAFRKQTLLDLHAQALEKSNKHCFKAFFRGLFIKSGYLQDPQCGYHFEMVMPGTWAVGLLKHYGKIFHLPFKFRHRRKRIVAYLKNIRLIIRTLKTMEAFDWALRLEDLAAGRHLLGVVNRQVNSETANINKQVAASERLRLYIMKLLEYPDPGIWTEALKQVALLRIQYPLDSLEALGKRCKPPISKSAVNHRLRRIVEIYKTLFEGVVNNESNDTFLKNIS